MNMARTKRPKNKAAAPIQARINSTISLQPNPESLELEREHFIFSENGGNGVLVVVDQDHGIPGPVDIQELFQEMKPPAVISRQRQGRQEEEGFHRFLRLARQRLQVT